MIFRKKYRKGIFMVTYAIENNKPVYVIQRRKLHWVGWEFPKGGIEKYESKKNTIKREIKEETGLEIIKITNHKVKGKYKYKKELKDRPGIIGQTYTLYSVEVKKDKIKFDKKEHTSSKWMTYEEAMKKLTFDNQKESLTLVHNWISDERLL
jgi:bis(5'-nucleosidyl)-tetraphosphatase